MTLAVAKLWISETRRVGGAFKGFSFFHSGVKECQSCSGWSCVLMRAFGIVGEMRSSSLCPTGVLPLLDVIAATTGYDLAVVEGGTVTCRDRCAQTRAQFRPD